MNQTRQQQSICSFLIILILLLGMCPDCIQTDSFLLYRSTELLSELSGQTSSALQKQITRRSFSTRTGKRNSFAYLLLASILMSESYDFMPDLRKTSIIIRYIQHKDGKKPQFSR